MSSTFSKHVLFFFTPSLIIEYNTHCWHMRFDKAFFILRSKNADLYYSIDLGNDTTTLTCMLGK